MKKLYSPKNDAELAVIRSILDGEGIQYFVHNDHFGTLQVGPPIDLFTNRRLIGLRMRLIVCSDEGLIVLIKCA